LIAPRFAITTVRTAPATAWRILGIDPGSRITGYGVIDVLAGRTRHVASGSIKTPDAEMPARLKHIFDAVTEVINAHHPVEMAIERVFMNRNADSALKLGQARGVALLAGANCGLVIHEFSPREVKQALVGRGSADKVQIQHMVRVLLALGATPAPDAADALAIALCHSHTRATLSHVPAAHGARAGRYR
jgi:crossover junction endodeoxyribonuclease RuvC